jgi:hypothetical protein
MNKLLDVLPEGVESVIKTVLTETDAGVIKVAIGGVALVAGIFALSDVIKHSINKDKVKDLSELVIASTSMVEAVSPSKEIKGVIGSIFGSKDK